MNCILNILSITETALMQISSVCSRKSDNEGKKEADMKDDQERRIIQSITPPVRIPRVVLMSSGRRSLAGIAAAIAKAGGFDNTRSLAYISTNDGSRFDGSSDDEDSDNDNDDSSRNGILIRRVSAGSYAGVGQSRSARGFYDIGVDQFGPHTL